jgi:hypothetical protein
MPQSQPSTQTNPKPGNAAAAMRDGKKPGPADAPVQVRHAGPEAMANGPQQWDDVDEAADESFPASDASAKY